MPHIKELASEIHESLAMIHQTMTRESCVALRWKHPRAFYVDTIKGQCEILAAEEKKVRSAARAKSLIQAALEKRNFPYARLLLEKLRMTRAPGWVLSDVASAIDAAERFERDTKAAVEAESRVKLLMAELPHVERLCRADLQARTYEHIQFERAIRIGATQKADDFQAKRDRSEERGCRARARAHEAYAIYEAQGRPVAAQSVLEVAPTCFRSFTCVD